jgi:hypothetical protein
VDQNMMFKRGTPYVNGKSGHFLYVLSFDEYLLEWSRYEYEYDFDEINQSSKIRLKSLNFKLK